MNWPISIRQRKKFEESLHIPDIPHIPHIPEQSTGEKKVPGERLGRKHSLVFIAVIVAVVILHFPRIFLGILACLGYYPPVFCQFI